MVQACSAVARTFAAGVLMLDANAEPDIQRMVASGATLDGQLPRKGEAASEETDA